MSGKWLFIAMGVAEEMLHVFRDEAFT